MHRRSITASLLFVLVFMAGGIRCSTIVEAPVVVDDSGSLRHSIARFSQHLLTAVLSPASSAPRDCILSPLSVLTDLAMTWYAARGRTATELQRALQLPDNRTRLQFGTEMRALLSALQPLPSGGNDANASAPAALLIANRIYVGTGGPRIAIAFNAAVQRDFLASVAAVDFGQPARAVDVINRFVSERTRGELPALLDADAVSADTQMVLVNAVYFGARWQTAFDARRTREGPFYVNGNAPTADDEGSADGGAAGTVVQVPYMHQTTHLLYADLPELGACAVAVPYEADAFRLVVVLPNAGFGGQSLATVVERLGDVSELRARLEWTNVRLALPKFETHFRTSLSGALQGLGIVTAFSSAADFGDMFAGGVGKVQISDVVHEARIRVSETGTVAAAGSAVIMSRMAAWAEDEVVVEANRPFLYYIEDAAGNVIFYGQFAGGQTN